MNDVILKRKFIALLKENDIYKAWLEYFKKSSFKDYTKGFFITVPIFSFIKLILPLDYYTNHRIINVIWLLECTKYDISIFPILEEVMKEFKKQYEEKNRHINYKMNIYSMNKVSYERLQIKYNEYNKKHT